MCFCLRKDPVRSLKSLEPFCQGFCHFRAALVIVGQNRCSGLAARPVAACAALCSCCPSWWTWPSMQGNLGTQRDAVLGQGCKAGQLGPCVLPVRTITTASREDFLSPSTEDTSTLFSSMNLLWQGPAEQRSFSAKAGCLGWLPVPRHSCRRSQPSSAAGRTIGLSHSPAALRVSSCAAVSSQQYHWLFT